MLTITSNMPPSSNTIHRQTWYVIMQIDKRVTLVAATDSIIYSHTEINRANNHKEDRRVAAMVASEFVSPHCAAAVLPKRDAKLALIVLVYLLSCLPDMPQLLTNPLDCAEGCC
jgi:hypothetical protein